MTTLIVSEQDWDKQELDVSAESFHHLFRVRRLRTGDRLRVVDGFGRARSARVDHIERSFARLVLGDPVPPNEAELRVELLVALPRPQRAAWLVEKATEAGVFAVRFINTRRDPRHYGPSTMSRLDRMARSAVEQSQRSRIPEVTAGHAWEEVPGLADRLDDCWVFDPSAPVTALKVPSQCASVGLLIGPEGGWEDDELALLTERGSVVVGLGDRVLRIETAALLAAGSLLVMPSVDTL